MVWIVSFNVKCPENMTPGVTFIDMIQLQSQIGQVITYPVKCGSKLLIHSQTSVAAPLKFAKG